MTYHAKMIKGGKIVIPADLRREFGIKDGDTVVLDRDGTRITLQSDQALMQELRAKVKARLRKPITVQSYLDQKWAEAATE